MPGLRSMLRYHTSSRLATGPGMTLAMRLAAARVPRQACERDAQTKVACSAADSRSGKRGAAAPPLEMIAASMVGGGKGLRPQGMAASGGGSI